MTSIAVHTASAARTVSTGLPPWFDFRSSKAMTWPELGSATNSIPPRCSRWTDLWVGTGSVDGRGRHVLGRPLGQELLAVQPGIEPALGQQLGVGAALDDPPAV